MREATAKEYAQATVSRTAAHLEKRIMPSKRCTTVQWSYCGTPVAEKTEIYSRGKIQSVSYLVNEKFLPESNNAE